jgi:glycosyltransferase involved in cell wall biosynthesis
MSDPLVSAVIATYNRGYCLAKAIESSLAQTYKPIEVIVVDDGSTDDTPEVMARYGDQIRCIRQDNLSQPVARNVGNAAARGEFIMVLDSDDMMPPNRAEASIELFHKYPDTDMVFGGYNTVDDQGRVTRHHDFSDNNQPCYLPAGQWDAKVEDCYAQCLEGGSGFCIHGTSCYRKSAIKIVGGYDTSFKCALDIKLRFLMGRCGSFAYTRHSLCNVTRGARETMSSSCERTIPNVLRAYNAELEYIQHSGIPDAARLEAIIRRKMNECWRDLAEERVKRRDRVGAIQALTNIAMRDRDREWWRLWALARLPRFLCDGVRRVKRGLPSLI